MTCAHCGRPVPADATFCPICGEMVLPEQPAAPEQPATPRPTPQPRVVPVPQRPAAPPARPTRTRQRVPAPPRPAPPSSTGHPQQGGYRQPQPGYRQPPPQGPPPGRPSGWPPMQPRRRPEPQIVVRGPGCASMLLRLFLLLLAIPVAIGVGLFLIGHRASSGTQPAASASTFASPAASSPAIGTTASATTAAAPRTDAASGVSTYPVVHLTGTACGRSGSGPYSAVAAGSSRTSCAFASAVRAAYDIAGGHGQPLTVAAYSAARRATQTVSCAGDQPVRCTTSDGALVFLYGGDAVFS